MDTWGGSPFNAANRVIGDNTNMDIVTGVNVPMLVETFMARDDNPSLQELVSIALETGRAGVRALKYEENRLKLPHFHSLSLNNLKSQSNNKKAISL